MLRNINYQKKDEVFTMDNRSDNNSNQPFIVTNPLFSTGPAEQLFIAGGICL